MNSTKKDPAVELPTLGPGYDQDDEDIATNETHTLGGAIDTKSVKEGEKSAPSSMVDCDNNSEGGESAGESIGSTSHALGETINPMDNQEWLKEGSVATE